MQSAWSCFTSIILLVRESDLITFWTTYIFETRHFLAGLRHDVRVIEQESLIVEIYNFYSRSNFFYLIYKFFS